MTRLQEMSLNYHFSVEQEVGSTTCQFFGFNGESKPPPISRYINLLANKNNSKKKTLLKFLIVVLAGTAGVWRIRAIRDAGGWKERTTVEDMDLAVRASLQGWKFVFVGDVSVISDSTSTLILSSDDAARSELIISIFF